MQFGTRVTLVQWLTLPHILYIYIYTSVGPLVTIIMCHDYFGLSCSLPLDACCILLIECCISVEEL